MTEAIEAALEPEALEIQRQFDANPDQMYRYFMEAEHLAGWFGPRGVECHDVRVDPRVGGRYAIEMTNPDGSQIRLVGEYLQLDAPSLIRMTWRWQREDDEQDGEETLVTIRFTQAGSGTLLRLTHERFAEPSERDRHDGGWTSSLDCLEEWVEKENQP